MLVLSRKVGETLVFTQQDGTRIELTVSYANGGRAKVTIDAPLTVRILRKELEDQPPTEKQCPSSS